MILKQEMVKKKEIYTQVRIIIYNDVIKLCITGKKKYENENEIN